MKFLNLGSIRRNLALLVIVAVLPALLILLYTGMEQRQQSISNAKRDVMLLTQAMAEVQNDMANSVKQTLSFLSFLPAVQNVDILACTEIFRAVLKQNPDYINIALTDLTGEVLVSGKPFKKSNLADRKHVQEAMANMEFSSGEYIVTRVGSKLPAFAFAYPVVDVNGSLKGVLTMAVNLARFSRFHDVSNLPGKSFVAVTDHKGVRLFFYPPKEKTNPIGKPIQKKSWEKASKAKESEIFVGKGSDGTSRIFAFEQIRLTPDDTPYIYVWAGIPEEHILTLANTALFRNLLLMFVATVIALFIAYWIGKNTLINPIKNLVLMTRKFAEGKLETYNEYSGGSEDEFGKLNKAFCDMADTLMTNQKTLQENEARFRLLMDSLDSLVYVADMDTCEILFINEYGKKLYGDITGKICWQSIQQGESGPCSFCTNKYLLNGDGEPGEIYTWEFQNTRTGNWYHIHDRAIKWVDGRIVRFEVATDISERKLAETRLAEETERLAVTLRSIGDGVITTDTQGRIILINKVAESLTGWSNAEATGLPLGEVFNIVDGETKQPCESLVEKILDSGNIIGLEERTVLISKNGHERNVADSGAPIRDKDGNIIGVVLVFRDITERLRTEQELVKVKKLESVGVLAGGIAHDFNNILAAILGNIDLSLLDPHLSVNTKKLLKEAVKAAFRARDLTQQLLTFSKGGEPIKKTASLADVVRDSADFILRGEKVACHYSFPKDLWLANIDKGQISQVVQNIMLNASNAMPDGGVVEVSCENVSTVHARSIGLPGNVNYVEMRIKDSGVGIPANVLDRVFDPYFSTKQEGSGLGLAITHSIVTKHGGHISVQSSPGEGTTFTIYLPASEQSLISVKEEEKQTQSAKKSMILVMDDEEQVRNVTEAMLAQIGHSVVLAKDGSETIRIFKKAMESDTPVDLIILDLTIPGGMGGRETVQKILEIDSEAKVIVASGYSNDPVMANFEDYGFCGSLIKPFQLVELHKVVSEHIG